MVKRHLKRLNAPKTWKILRRGIKFITRNNPGGMHKDLTTSVSTILKYELKLANSIKEVKHLVKSGEVFVNGKKISDYRHALCFTDVLTFPKLNQSYRLIVDIDNTLKVVPISKEESSLKIVKIIGKSFVKGKIQLNLMDGRNVLFEKHHYKVGDSLVLTIPEQIVKDHLSFEKGMLALLYKGNHVGKIGTIFDVKKDSVVIKTANDTYETKKDYVIIVGKDKPEIKLTK